MANEVKWARGESVRLEKNGHRIFREDRGEFAAPETCRWAIADNSGATPDRTDDGILWLDFSRPLLVEIGQYGIVSIPVDKDRDVQGGSYWCSAGVDALVTLREKFPRWEIEMGPNASKLVRVCAEVQR